MTAFAGRMLCYQQVIVRHIAMLVITCIAMAWLALLPPVLSILKLLHALNALQNQPLQVTFFPRGLVHYQQNMACTDTM
jgi:hypothetical protein